MTSFTVGLSKIVLRVSLIGISQVYRGDYVHAQIGLCMTLSYQLEADNLQQCPT
jgi:hypothetical protein